MQRSPYGAEGVRMLLEALHHNLASLRRVLFDPRLDAASMCLRKGFLAFPAKDHVRLPGWLSHDQFGSIEAASDGFAAIFLDHLSDVRQGFRVGSLVCNVGFKDRIDRGSRSSVRVECQPNVLLGHVGQGESTGTNDDTSRQQQCTL